MGFFATILVGLVVGLLASWLMKAKTGVFIDLLLGIAGSVLGGWITSLVLGVNLMTGFNLTSIIVGLLGAILVIVIFRLIKRR